MTGQDAPIGTGPEGEAQPASRAGRQADREGVEMKRTRARQAAHRGGVLVSSVVFALIVSLGVAAMGKLAVSQYDSAIMDDTYAQALPAAEAGIDYEFRKISSNPYSADQSTFKSPAGSTYSLGQSSFQVYCTNLDGTTPWYPPAKLYVVAKGTVDGVSRTVRVSAKGFGGIDKFAVFALQSGTLNGTVNISGSVGTNGTLTFNGTPTVTGQVVFNGPGSGWSAGSGGTGYSTVYNSSTVTWPTVDQVAEQDFPSGGLTWLASNNDNLLVPQITDNTLTVSNGTVTFVGKAGGANYYLTSLKCTGSGSIAFDNTNGPINIWMGPDGGAGTCKIGGGTALVSMSQNPLNACKIYSALSSGVTVSGSATLDAGIYAYNTNGDGQSTGSITLNGGAVVNGSILAPSITALNGTPTVNYSGYYFEPTSGYFGLDNSWTEVGCANE